MIRIATHADRAFLERMFLAAARVPASAIRENEQLARYFDAWGRDGDFALIAGDHLGAAWWRLFPANAPGYGYVADDIPELGIAVEAEHRGRGIGRALLEALQNAARERGHRALSLSVQPDNPARRLYERAGFTPVDATTMLWSCR